MSATVISIAGHDPTTGAGSTAHIETLRSLGVTPIACLSCITSQNTSNVHQIHSLPAQQLIDQALVAGADIPPNVGVLGLLGSVEAIQASLTIMQHWSIPWIIDPILKAGGGKDLADGRIVEAYLAHLVPLSTLITPNVTEAQRLTGTPTEDPAALCEQLLRLGAPAVLLTTTDNSDGETIRHYFANKTGSVSTLSAPRLAGRFHGSGCTLAAAIAGYLALGHELFDACTLANDYALNTLRHAFHPGSGAFIPNRTKYS